MCDRADAHHLPDAPVSENRDALPTPDSSPFVCGGSALADSARSLAMTLAAARDTREESTSALRETLIDTAYHLCESWEQETEPIDSRRALAYHQALWQIRIIAADLPAAQRPESSGLPIALRAFGKRYRPGALLAFRPAGIDGVLVREHLRRLRERCALVDVDSLFPQSPSEYLLARYPVGEQENTLMACSALHFFHEPRPSHVFATSVGGPAHFFALAANMQSAMGFTDSLAAPTLAFVSELLEIFGWLDHATIGPLLRRWRAHFGLTPDYLDRMILSEPMLRTMRKTQEEYRVTPPAYTPQKFDREVPAMWERIRAGSSLCPDAGASGGADNVMAILNAGWSFAQVHMTDLYVSRQCRTSEDRYHARFAVNRLLGQSIADCESAVP